MYFTRKNTPLSGNRQIISTGSGCSYYFQNSVGIFEIAHKNMLNFVFRFR